MCFAGTPATTVLLGTSFVTTEPAATTALSPIIIPGKIVDAAPIHAFLFISIGLHIKVVYKVMKFYKTISILIA